MAATMIMIRKIIFTLRYLPLYTHPQFSKGTHLLASKTNPGSHWHPSKPLSEQADWRIKLAQVPPHVLPLSL